MLSVYSVDEQPTALFVRDLQIRCVFVEREECRGTAFPRTFFLAIFLVKFSMFENYCLVSAVTRFFYPLIPLKHGPLSLAISWKRARST